MQTKQTSDRWQSANFPPLSLSCFTAEALTLPLVSISGQVDRRAWQ